MSGVRVGKAIRFTVDAPDEGAARERAAALCQRLLANPVIENAEITIENGNRP